MEYFHLTTPQQNIWNLQKYYENTAIANLCGAIFYQEKRDSTLLQQAVLQFIRSQSGIRLQFCEAEEPKQYVSNEIDENIPVMTFETMEEFDRYAQNFAKEPVGLIDCPMYRFVVFQIKDKSGILVVLSHLVSDAWTFGLMAKQVEEAYYRLAEENPIVPVGGDYIDYIESEEKYLCSDRYEKDKLYWEEKYNSRPEEGLIKLCPVPSNSITAKRITRVLPLPLEQKIESYCNKYPVTQAVLFEMALVIYLSKINVENQSVTVGVLVLNRSNAREKKIAGMFASTMPLTVAVTDTMTVTELAKQITKGHMDTFRHQKYPYANILKDLREKQNFSGNLYDVMISYQNAATDTGADTKWYSNGYSEVPFVVHIDNRDGHASHTINVDYQTAVFRDEVEIEYIIERLEYILEQIVEENGKQVKDICVVPEQEMEKLIYEFNDTYIDYSREKCVHELFSEQAERTPEKTALVFEDKKFTYKQLDEMSNSLAHFLREKGVKPNDVVPIIAKRSWHVIVAMLGVLKAGGAFMSIDIYHPYERIIYMLDNAKIKFILRYEDGLKIDNYQFYSLDFIDYKNNCNKVENINKSTDMCYTIYTSGTTGNPKGLCITHNNAVNFSRTSNLNINCKIVNRADSGFLSITNTIFDMFITELLIPLTSGGKLILANEKESISSEELNLLCNKHRPDIIETTPTKLKMLLSEQEKFNYIKEFKKIILGGEVLTVSFLKNLKSITRAEIFNNYGPAETTVWSTISLIKEEDITIGKPIANTQIYILDKENNPLPIGVAGELCIAGEGVGKGYLNRPELTAERFVPNPFATEKNHHGKVMYHTGDLARWRADGEIEYLGRIDTQVKIRGLRIELGEIENVMSSFNGIGLTAVADKRDENNRQYLVGYYTSEKEIEEKKLRQHLSAKLPKYMIPNYFMRLAVMPMTPSGKTDRKNLPLPDFTVQTTEYIAPITEREKKLCHLLKELFHMKQIGTMDDFFELGGDSLTAIEYVAKAHSRGIDFALQNVFDYPTVQSLCGFLEKGDSSRVHYVASDFDKYQQLFAENVIDEAFVPKKKSLGNVLLTGATGFLGAHVLEQLLQKETGKIYCLIRSGKKDDRRGRIHDILQYYFGDKYETEFGNRIIPVVGDIELDGLAEHMPTDVQTVIHTAATVKHYGSYEYFHRVNVEGTQHIVDYAKNIGAKLIHISTLSVSGNSMADDFTVYHSEEEKYFYETSLYMEQPLDNVYIHSKFEAEKAVYDAILQGLEAKVIRVGNLTNRASDYKFQPNYKENAFLTRVKAVLEFGLFPDYLMPLYAEFSPVDLTAEGIVRIAQYADKQCIFHLNSNRPIYFERFLEVVHELGISMKVVEGANFQKALQQTMKNSSTEYIFEAFQNDMDEQGRLVYDSNIHIVNDFTVWFLKKTGFEWNETDMEYIRGYIEYFREIGYLEV